MRKLYSIHGKFSGGYKYIKTQIKVLCDCFNPYKDMVLDNGTDLLVISETKIKILCGHINSFRDMVFDNGTDLLGISETQIKILCGHINP